MNFISLWVTEMSRSQETAIQDFDSPESGLSVIDPGTINSGVVCSHHFLIKMTNKKIHQNLIKPDVVSFLQQAPPSSSSSTAAREDSFRPGSLFRQLADQDEDTAAPSLFKLSWLSGMAK